MSRNTQAEKRPAALSVDHLWKVRHDLNGGCNEKGRFIPSLFLVQKGWLFYF